MQTGAVSITNGQINSVNLDDCVGLSTSKLTISMRTANAGKNENNIKLGNLAKIVTDLQKDNPTYQLRYLAQDPILNQEIVLDYSDNNGRISGDMISSSIDDSTIDSVVNNLGDNETLVVITEGDNDFAASRTKYADLKTADGKKKVVFSKEFTIGGAEYDFAIINENFSDNVENKVTEIKRLYTLATRARKGSIIKQSNGLTNVLKVSSKPSITAASEIAFDSNSEVAKQYKRTRLAALNNIPKQITPEKSDTGEGEGKNGKEDFPSEDIDFGRNQDGSEKVTDEEIIQSVDDDTDDLNNIPESEPSDDGTADY